MRFGATFAALVLGLVIAAAPLYAQPAPRFEGRPLADALKELERRGLRIIYSSEAVRPEMRVPTEPNATSLRRLLDELLVPHGLLAREGPGGRLSIVKDLRARPKRIPPAPPLISTAAATVAGAAEPVRFEESITVTDVSPALAAGAPLPLGPVDVRNLAGGFENVFRALQTLPGVSAADEMGSRIAVRGGGPDENLTIMDGVEIHNPYRLFVASEDTGIVGLASTFNPETIDTVSLYPGAFDVRYGDRLSSLLVVTNRDGSETEAFQGFGFISLTDVNVVAEGKLPHRASGSWLVTARRTHLDLLAERAIGVGLPSFQDVQTKVSWRPSPGRRLSVLGIAGREGTEPGDLTLRDESRSARTRNRLLAVTFDSSLGPRASSRTVASYSRFDDQLASHERSLDNSRGANTVESINQGGLLEFRLARDVAVRDVALRQEFVFKPSARHWVDAGGELHRLDTRWTWEISGVRSQHQANASSMRLGRSLPASLDSSRDSVRGGVWLQDRIKVSSHLTLQPGMRLDHSSLTGDSSLSPRVSGALELGRGYRVDAALGVHAQSPGYEKLFQSDYFVDLSEAQTSGLHSERALHLGAGVQKRFTNGLIARADVYDKWLGDLVVGSLETEEQRVRRLATYDVPTALRDSVPTRTEVTTVPVNGANGRAHGVDLHLAYMGRGALAPLTGWAGYSYGHATRTAYGITYPSDYDRRHSASVVASARIGPRLDLSITGRWTTGLPRTPVRGTRLALVPDAADEDGDGNRAEQIPQRDAAGNPLFQPDLGDLTNVNTARLPHFARLDARITWRPPWGGDRWAVYADLLNVFNAKNVFQIDSALVLDPASDRPRIIERAVDRGIPFFPSIGIRVWF